MPGSSLGIETRLLPTPARPAAKQRRLELLVADAAEVEEA